MLFSRICRWPEVAVAPGSASITTPLPEVTPPASGAAAPSFSIPDTYKDRPYLKGVDSVDKVYAMLDGAQSLLGKRPAGIPAPDAPAEDWAKFYDALGRPKTAGEYTFDGVDKVDPKFLPKLQEVFHKHGLNATQAKGIFADVNAVLGALVQEKGVVDEKQNTDFDALGTKIFGVDRDKILASSKALLDQHTPPELKAEVAKLSNENLIVMAGVLNNISKMYIKEDGSFGKPTVTGLSPTDVSARARTLMMTKDYTDPFHPNHAVVKKQVDELYASMRK